MCTSGTFFHLKELGINTKTVAKFTQGNNTAVRLLREGKIDLVLNTPTGADYDADESALRLAALRYGVPCITSVNAIAAVLQILQTNKEHDVYCLQEY